MHLLSAENISKSYSEKKLLENVSLGINEGDKIGLIGINGTGKTTFLKIIAGVEKPDKGEIIKSTRLETAYLPQEPDFALDMSVLEYVCQGNHLMKMALEYNKAVADPKASGEEITRLARRMDAEDAWGMESEARTILTKLGCGFFDTQIAALSGGQKKRVALAGTLVKPSDLLIMDEPTNHLDSEAIEWLEEYLSKKKGALLMITHDRYFLDRVTNMIVELDKGDLYSYKGNYSYFLQKKLEREEIAKASEEKRRNILRNELAWIKRGAKARSTKQKARIERFHRLKEEGSGTARAELEMSVAGSRLGKKVIELEHVGKGYGDRTLIKDFSLKLTRDDRIGIVGPNGCGKTTLLNLMSGKIAPDKGKVETGDTVKVGMYSQEMLPVNEKLRVIEYIREESEQITTAEGETISAAQMLERFLFPPDLQWSPVEKLSGGEKRRLHLLKVLAEGPNVLLLDEPTNDLDVETLAILEDYLDNFKGAVIAVSHDRYFLDRMADKIYAFEGSGSILQYTGNYSLYREKKEQLLRDNGESVSAGNKALDSPNKTSGKQADKKHKAASWLDRGKPLKLSYREKKEYEAIEGVISGLEEKIKNLQTEIEAAGADYILLEKLCSQQAEAEEQLNEKMERWVYLNELAEKTGKK